MLVTYKELYYQTNKSVSVCTGQLSQQQQGERRDFRIQHHIGTASGAQSVPC